MDEPQQPTGAAAEAHFARRVHERVFGAQGRLVSRPGLGISRTTRGIIQTVRVPAAGLRGWHWASPKKYDATKAYALNEITIVGPNNDAVANGATPGEWICLREPVIDPETDFVHLPIWPPPGISEEDALDFPDDIRIYWWPQQLYCV